MSVRSLNKVLLIGNLTRDPELRYTPNGVAVCSFGVATNRSWTTDSGERKEETEFHRIVSWNKLAELCSQLLSKGRKVFVEGRLQTRSWQTQDGQQRQSTEIVIDDMIILDSRRFTEGDASTRDAGASMQSGSRLSSAMPQTAVSEKKDASVESTSTANDTSSEKTPEANTSADQKVNLDDIPF